MSNELAPFIVKAKKGEVLFREGDDGNEMYFIHAGRVRIEMNVDGKPETLAMMEKGDFFGEMSVIDQIPRTATATVEEDGELLKVDTANFEKLISANIEIAIRMIRKYSARLRDTNAKLEAVLQDSQEMSSGIQEVIQTAKKPKDSEEPQAGAIDFTASFLHEDKTKLPITGNVVMIGRKDPVTGIKPNVDLTDLDVQRSVSRKHAMLQYLEGQFLLTEEVGVANGTSVNGVRLVAGQPVTLSPGAVVQFGNVQVTFSTESSN